MYPREHCLAEIPMRETRLTIEFLARVPRFSGGSGRLAGRADLPTEEHWGDVADRLLCGRPADGEVWIFAYGSLIRDPGLEFVEELLGVVRAGTDPSALFGCGSRGTLERPR
jgi:hypothetical protein